jgi:hypothetical protein
MIEKLPQLGQLLEERNKIQEELKVNTGVLSRADHALQEYIEKLKNSTPWWKKVFREVFPREDKEFNKLHQLYWEASGKNDELKRQIGTLESRIQRDKKERKWIDAAIKMRELMHRNKLGMEKNKIEYWENCLKEKGFERDLFLIREKDYKRGNRLDNFFRNHVPDKIITIFDEGCCFCESKEDLTLDHYAIPKNEGGNFILFDKRNGTLRINLVVLCRSCNAMKGEARYWDFFDEDKIKLLGNYHEKVLSFILSDQEAIKIIKRWYEIPIGVLPGFQSSPHP